MPPEFWQASPTMTNGNEQSHHNINRDAINLTLLGEIMHGQYYDGRVSNSLNTNTTYGIQQRDKASTYSPTLCLTDCFAPRSVNINI